MNTFLYKISQLEAIRDVLLLSLQGELLFCTQTGGLSSSLDRQVAIFNAIILELGHLQAAEFVFATGRYYLHATDLGFLIIGMTGDKSLSKIRQACANVHEKLVDREIRKRVLLKMLSEGEQEKKPSVVNALMPLADEEVAHALLPVLQQAGTLPPDLAEKLLISLLGVLGRSSASDTLPVLKKLLQKYSTVATPGGKAVEAAAKLVIGQLESAHPPERAADTDTVTKLQSPATDIADEAHDEHLAQYNPEDLQIRQLLDQGHKGQAIALIMEHISNYARAKNFQRAEHLRDWLMDIDSMALIESIRAAEIIEEEKSAAISDEYLQTWEELVKALSKEEFASLYHATTQRNYADGEMVVRQGEFRSTLFFINSGRVHIYAISQGREVPLTILGAGEVLGGDTFFDASVWTVNVVSKGAALSLLTWQRLRSQKENCPALLSKLQDYCTRFESIAQLFIKSRRSRRQFERKKMSGRVTIDLLDEKDQATGLSTKGELLDISKGGLALSLRFSKKKNASALLGKRIRVNIRHDASAVNLLRIGQVMAVRCHDFVGNDYSLHVEFETELSNGEIPQAAVKGR